MTAQLGIDFYATEALDSELDDDISDDEFAEWRGDRSLERRLRRDERRVARRSTRGRLPPLNAEGQVVSACLQRCLQRVIPPILRRLRTCGPEIRLRRTQSQGRSSTSPTGGQPSHPTDILSRLHGADSPFSRMGDGRTPPGSTTPRPAISPGDVLDAESGRLRYAFDIDVSRLNADTQIDDVIDTFVSIQRYLHDDSTFIHRLRSDDPDIVGLGFGTENLRDGGGRRISQRRIFLGDAWFNTIASPVYFNLEPCNEQNLGHVVEDGTLIHESVHLVHGPGHSSLGARRNPIAYELYVMAFECGRQRLSTTPSEFELAGLASQ